MELRLSTSDEKLFFDIYIPLYVCSAFEFNKKVMSIITINALAMGLRDNILCSQTTNFRILLILRRFQHNLEE